MKNEITIEGYVDEVAEASEKAIDEAIAILRKNSRGLIVAAVVKTKNQELGSRSVIYGVGDNMYWHGQLQAVIQADKLVNQFYRECPELEDHREFGQTPTEIYQKTVTNRDMDLQSLEKYKVVIPDKLKKHLGIQDES